MRACTPRTSIVGLTRDNLNARDASRQGKATFIPRTEGPGPGSTCATGGSVFIDHHKRELLEYLLSRSPFIRRWNYLYCLFHVPPMGPRVEVYTCLQCARCTEDETPATDLSPKSRLGGLSSCEGSGIPALQPCSHRPVGNIYMDAYSAGLQDPSELSLHGLLRPLLSPRTGPPGWVSDRLTPQVFGQWHRKID
mgnify:CR=1 FL=1